MNTIRKALKRKYIVTRYTEVGSERQEVGGFLVVFKMIRGMYKNDKVEVRLYESN